MRQALYVRVLKQTAKTLGDHEALAVFLNVAPSVVERWMNGSVPIPPDVFLACVDHLIDWQFAYVRDLLFDETKGTGQSQQSSAEARPVRREAEDSARGDAGNRDS
jgi:hypothetical protein